MNIFKKLNTQVENAGKKDNSGRKRRVLYGGYSVEEAIEQCAEDIEYVIDSMGLAGTNPEMK